MKTIHAIADPYLRVELSTHGQYCEPTNPGTQKKGGRTKKRQRVGDDRDYFDEYCASVFPDWNSCKELAATLNNADDEQLVANLDTYGISLQEENLYEPFEYLANRALELARVPQSPVHSKIPQF